MSVGAPANRAHLAAAVQAELEVDAEQASKIVQAFDDYLAKPLEENLDQPGNSSVVELYAIQSAPNTKSAGGRRSDIPDFRARLIRVTAILSALVKVRAANEVARITREAEELFGDREGGLKLDALADPPRLPRRSRP